MAKFAAKDSNKNITLSPHGTGKVVVGTGAADATVQSDGNHNLVLQTGNSTTGSISVTDGADGNISLTPNGTGEIVIGSGSASGKITSSGAHDLVLDTNAGTNSGNITIIDGADAGIAIEPNGTGIVSVGNASNQANISSNGAQHLLLDTRSGTDTGSILIRQGANQDIDITPNGSGEVNISKVDIDAGTIDGTTIATSDITVGAGKTLDVSAGTFTTSTAQKEAITAAVFASGTKMLFQQTAAPTGWTKVTSSDDVALRVVSGTVGSGGSVAFETAFASQTISAHSGGSVDNKTLAESNIPQHNHAVKGSTQTAGSDSNIIFDLRSSAFNNLNGTSGNYGGASPVHNHSFTQPSNHSAINLDVSYVDVIIATKD